MGALKQIKSLLIRSLALLSIRSLVYSICIQLGYCRLIMVIRTWLSLKPDETVSNSYFYWNILQFISSRYPVSMPKIIGIYIMLTPSGQRSYGKVGKVTLAKHRNFLNSSCYPSLFSKFLLFDPSSYFSSQFGFYCNSNRKRTKHSSSLTTYIYSKTYRFLLPSHLSVSYFVGIILLGSRCSNRNSQLSLLNILQNQILNSF